MCQGENGLMSLNTKTDSGCSVDEPANSKATSQLNLNRLKSETIKNKHTSSELDLIYLEDAEGAVAHADDAECARPQAPDLKSGERTGLKSYEPDCSVILQVKGKNKPVETYYGFNPKAAKRIKSAWEWEAEAELIAIASASENSLFVMGCDLKTWEIPFSSLPCLDRVPQSQKGNFELDEDGSYLYWECADLHVDLEDIKAAVDPKFKEQLLIKKLEYGKSLGSAIAAVRKAHKLNQDGIDGLSGRHLRRIENEGVPPTLDALKKLAASHGLDLEDYLAQVNQSLFKTKS